MFQDADHISIYMSFTHSTFTFINCEDPSKRFTITNDEIRQMELKINVAYRRSGNWEHIANHLYNFYSKIGVIGQPKSNRNVYSNEYTELLELKDKSYADVLKEDRLIRQEQGVQIKYAKDDAHLLNKKQHIERHASWETYTTNYVSNMDDNISNPSVVCNDYSNNLAMTMMKKLNVDTSSEYVSSAQLHMNDRFRTDIKTKDEEFEKV
tara:strand:- start:6468 stop:7094 length:627 start_codon:yes stop_codon:yes gene_type:complete